MKGRQDALHPTRRDSCRAVESFGLIQLPTARGSQVVASAGAAMEESGCCSCGSRHGGQRRLLQLPRQGPPPPETKLPQPVHAEAVLRAGAELNRRIFNNRVIARKKKQSDHSSHGVVSVFRTPRISRPQPCLLTDRCEALCICAIYTILHILHVHVDVWL